MKDENRLRLRDWTGNNVNSVMNFHPKMRPDLLVEGYKSILRTIYSQKAYFERVKTFLREYRLPSGPQSKIKGRDIVAFLKAIWSLGILEKERSYFWKLVLHVLRYFPSKLPHALSLAIRGFHFRYITAVVTST